MGRRIQLTARLPVADLEQRYRGARDPVARSQWQIVWLLAQGHQAQQVARVTGYSAKWVGVLARRYSRAGPAALGDGRRQNPGAKRLLSPAQQAALAAALAGPAPDGGLWTGRQVARWMSEQLGQRVWPQRGWVYLRRLGYTPQRPRPRHAQADAADQAAFRKASRGKSPRSSRPTRTR